MAYEPAGMTTASPGLAHIASKIYYSRKGLDRLQKVFRFREAFDPETFPRLEGRVATFFRYDNLAASTTPKAEGVVGTSLSVSSNTVAFTLSQFANFISASDFLVDTGYDSTIANYADLLGYRAGLSVDTMFRNVIDAASAATALTTLGPVFTVADLRQSRAVLAGIDVKPFDDGLYFAIMHPYTSFDLVNDPAANGLADIHKFKGVPGNSPLLKQEDRGWVVDIASTRVVESTNVFTTGTPTQYRTYVFGKGGLKMLDLAGRGPSNVTNPDTQRFKINIIKPQGPSIPDPEGVIGGAVSYNFITTGGFVSGPAGIGGPYRSRTFDQISSLS